MADTVVTRLGGAWITNLETPGVIHTVAEEIPAGALLVVLWGNQAANTTDPAISDSEGHTWTETSVYRTGFPRYGVKAVYTILTSPLPVGGTISDGGVTGAYQHWDVFQITTGTFGSPVKDLEGGYSIAATRDQADEVLIGGVWLAKNGGPATLSAAGWTLYGPESSDNNVWHWHSAVKIVTEVGGESLGEDLSWSPPISTDDYIPITVTFRATPSGGDPDPDPDPGDGGDPPLGPNPPYATPEGEQVPIVTFDLEFDIFDGVAHDHTIFEPPIRFACRGEQERYALPASSWTALNPPEDVEALVIMPGPKNLVLKGASSDTGVPIFATENPRGLPAILELGDDVALGLFNRETEDQVADVKWLI